MQAVISRVHRIVTASGGGGGDAADGVSSSPPPSAPSPPVSSSSSAFTPAFSSPSPPPPPADASSALTPEMRLAVERLQYATLLGERKKAAKQLQELARRVAAADKDGDGDAAMTALGGAAIPALLSALVSDPRDTELMEAMLELLQELVAAAPATASALLESPQANNNSSSSASAFALQIPSAPTSGIQICLQLLQDPSPWIRGPTVALVKAIQEAKQREFAAAVLECKEGLRRLLEVVEDKREHIRDAALQVLVKLTEREKLVQQFLAFEDGFARLFQIMEAEGLADGSSVISDCLQIVNNMVRDNLMTQTLLREMPYLETHLPELLCLPRRDAAAALHADAAVTTTKSYQKRRALKLGLQLVRFLVAGLHEGVPDAKLDELSLRERARKEAELSQIQSFIGRQSALMGAIGELACCQSEELTDLQLQALDLLELLGSSNGGNQIILVNLQSKPSHLSVLAEFVRLDFAEEESPVSAAATSLLDSLFRNNETTKMAIFQQLNAPPPIDDGDDDDAETSSAAPAGRVLLDALMTNAEAIVKGSVQTVALRTKTIVAWKACHRLTSLLANSDYCKDLALRIPSEYENPDAQAVPGGRFLTRCLRLLGAAPMHASDEPGLPASVFHIKVAVLCLLIQWSLSCTKAVYEIVGSVTNLSILVELFTREELGSQRLQSEATHLQGLVAMLLGCCLEFLVDARQQELDQMHGLPTISPPSSSKRQSSGVGMTRTQLLEMISKRIGLQRFTDAFVAFQQAPLVIACARGSKSHSSRNVLPPRASMYGDEDDEQDASHGEYLFALYEKAFLSVFRDIGDRIQKRIIAIYTGADSGAQDGAATSASTMSAYQDLIRIQDKQIQEMEHELAALRAGSQGRPQQNDTVAGQPAIAHDVLDAAPKEVKQVPHTSPGGDEELRSEIAALRNELRSMQSELDRGRETQVESEREIERLRASWSADKQAADARARGLEWELAQLVSEREEQQRQSAELKERLESEVARLQTEKSDMEQQVARLGDEVTAAAIQAAEMRAASGAVVEQESSPVSSEMEELHELRAFVDHMKSSSAAAAQELESRTSEVARLVQELAQVTASSSADKEAADARVGELENQLAHLMSERDELQRQLGETVERLESEVARLMMEKSELEQRVMELSAIAAAATAQAEAAGEALQVSSKPENSSVSSELEELRAVVERMKGLSEEATKEIEMKNDELKHLEREVERVMASSSADKQGADARARELEGQLTQLVSEREELQRQSAATKTRLESEIARLLSETHNLEQRVEQQVTDQASEREGLQRQSAELKTRLESEIARLLSEKSGLEQQVVAASSASVEAHWSASNLKSSPVSSEPETSDPSSPDDMFILLASLEIQCETLRESLRAAKGEAAVVAAEEVSRQRGAVII